MAELFAIRKTMFVVEDINHDLGPRRTKPVRRAAALAVATNPYVGRYLPDLSAASAELRMLGESLGRRLMEVIGTPEAIDSYGKGAIVGEAGEIEHGAMWHIPGGHGMRAALGKGEAIVPSTKKVASMGARLDVPLTHLAWSYVGSHYDAMEVGVPDAPRANEIVFILAMGIGGRVHARLAGGFSLEDKGKVGSPA